MINGVVMDTEEGMPRWSVKSAFQKANPSLQNDYDGTKD
jgi:hypothetical protein